MAAAACFMSLTVVMSAAHAKDLLKGSSGDVAVMGRTVDPITKAIGDLHNHIDKQTLKNISMDNPVTAREREVRALNEEKTDRGWIEILEELAIFYRLAFSLRLSATFA